jgi:hypothetical protein
MLLEITKYKILSLASSPEKKKEDGELHSISCSSDQHLFLGYMCQGHF